MEFEFDNFKDSFSFGIKYLPVTAKIAFVALFFGIVFGLLIAIVRYYKIPVLSQLLAVIVTLYQGLPTMVALLIYNLLFSIYIGDIIKLLHLNIAVRAISLLHTLHYLFSPRRVFPRLSGEH